jgi:hypothetical protein
MSRHESLSASYQSRVFSPSNPENAFLFLLGRNYSVDLTRRQVFDRLCQPDDGQEFLPYILSFCTLMRVLKIKISCVAQDKNVISKSDDVNSVCLCRCLSSLCYSVNVEPSN